jgi:hypothetical protein
MAVVQWQRGKRHGFGLQTFVPDNEMGYHDRMGAGGVDTLYRIERFCSTASLVYLTQRSCAGQLAGSVIESRGCLLRVLVHSYHGEWKEGDRTGLGTIVYANGDKYSGYFNCGRLDGRVRIKFGYVSLRSILRQRQFVRQP